jgi:hypothetical protein
MKHYAVYMCVLATVFTVYYGAVCIGSHSLAKLPAFAAWLAMALAWGYQIRLDRRC